MTPFTNGNSRLIARAETNALARVEGEREGSNIERVAEDGWGGAGADAGASGKGDAEAGAWAGVEAETAGIGCELGC